LHEAFRSAPRLSNTINNDYHLQFWT
jgi:hypothetical protein